MEIFTNLAPILTDFIDKVLLEMEANVALFALVGIILAALIVLSVEINGSAKRSARRHSALIEALEKAYFYQQESDTQVSNNVLETKTLISKHTQEFGSLFGELGNLWKGLEEKIEAIPAHPSTPDSKQNNNAELLELRDLIKKNAMFMYDEFSAMSEKFTAVTHAQGKTNGTGHSPELAASLAQLGEKLEQKVEALQHNAGIPVQLTESLSQLGQKIEALQHNASVPVQLTESLSQLGSKVESLRNNTGTNPELAGTLAQFSGKLEALQLSQAQAPNTMLAESLAQLRASVEIMQQTQRPQDNTMLFEMLGKSMDRLSSEVDAKLTLLGSKMEKNLDTRLSDTVASINTLRSQITELNNANEKFQNMQENMTSLSRLMQTRVGISEESGRQQLAELLPQILAEDYYQVDFDLPNGHSVAAVVQFPDPKDSVVIDAGLSLQTFADSMADGIGADERDQLRQKFRRELIHQIDHIADNLLIPPHTGESALLFVPSEAAFADIHTYHRPAIRLALSRRVWLVSPTTLIAVLNTASNAIRDHQASFHLQKLQETLTRVVEEAQLFENRLTEIGDHVNSAWRSVQRAENASGRLIGSIRSVSNNASESTKNITATPVSHAMSSREEERTIESA